jgi:hypothetical protein
MSPELEKETLKLAWRALSESRYLDDDWTGAIWACVIHDRKIVISDCMANVLPKLIKEIAKYELSKDSEVVKPALEELKIYNSPSQRPKQYKSPRERGVS